VAADVLAGSSTPDKRRLVLSSQQQQQHQANGSGPGNSAASKPVPAATAAAAAAASSSAAVGSHSLEKVDRLAEWEQQQQDAFGGLTQAQLDEAGKRLAAMSSSARRKVCTGP
jgi:hypothetical protein